MELHNRHHYPQCLRVCTRPKTWLWSTPCLVSHRQLGGSPKPNISYFLQGNEPTAETLPTSQSSIPRNVHLFYNQPSCSTDPVTNQAVKTIIFPWNLFVEIKVVERRTTSLYVDLPGITIPTVPQFLPLWLIPTIWQESPNQLRPQSIKLAFVLKLFPGLFLSPLGQDDLWQGEFKGAFPRLKKIN